MAIDTERVYALKSNTSCGAVGLGRKVVMGYLFSKKLVGYNIVA